MTTVYVNGKEDKLENITGDYVIIQSGDLTTLTHGVALAKALGYKPQGGVSSFIIHDRSEATWWFNTYFMQAVVK